MATLRQYLAPTVLLSVVTVGSGSWAKEPMALRTFESGRLSMMVPTALKPASEKLARLKYMGRVPAKNILTDANGAVNLVVRLGPKPFPAKAVPTMAPYARKTFARRKPGLVWHTADTRTINGRVYAFLEFTSPALDTKVRNLMLISSVDGLMLVISFNVTVARQANWLPMARKMIASVRVNK